MLNPVSLRSKVAQRIAKLEDQLPPIQILTVFVLSRPAAPSRRGADQLNR
jgi:hypothetical protein